MTIPTREAGFTLFELIVALAISSLVAMIGAAALSTALDTYARNAERTGAREVEKAVERTLRHEWSTRGRLVRYDGQVLEFDTVHPVGNETPDWLTVARVQYRCEVQEGSGMTLTHRITSLPDPTRPPGSSTAPPRFDRTEALATRLRTCGFSLLGTVKDERGRSEPRWLSRWDEKTPPPSLMRMTVSSLGGDAPPVVFQARTGERAP